MHTDKQTKIKNLFKLIFMLQSRMIKSISWLYSRGRSAPQPRAVQSPPGPDSTPHGLVFTALNSFSSLPSRSSGSTSTNLSAFNRKRSLPVRTLLLTQTHLSSSRIAGFEIALPIQNFSPLAATIKECWWDDWNFEAYWWTALNLPFLGVLLFVFIEVVPLRFEQ